MILATLATILHCARAAPGPYAPLKPSAGATWNIELSHVPKPAQAADASYHIWDFDMAEAPKSTIEAFHSKGHPVICYFSAGSWEKWRKDADQFPEVALGKTLEGWPNERWLNTSNVGVRQIMRDRIEDAANKGCDGVDPDNIDGYENGEMTPYAYPERSFNVDCKRSIH